MGKPFDVSLKELVERYPADWLPLAGLSVTAAIEVIDADVATITAAADKVLLVREAAPWLLHLELQSSPQRKLAERLQWYNVLLRHRHGRPVRTVLVLLRPAADGSGITGLYQDRFPGEPPHQEFHYRVVRIWQTPVGPLLAGGLGTLPLALLSAAGTADLPGVVRQIDERLAQEASGAQGALLGAATYLLAGLRLPPAEVVHLFQGARFIMSIVKDSSTYQVILEEGMAKGMAEGKAEGALEELRKTLLRQGRKRFGPAEATTTAALEAISDLERLERMSERLLDAAGWSELLATP